MTGSAGLLLQSAKVQILLGILVLVVVAGATYLLTDGSSGDSNNSADATNIPVGSFGDVTQPGLDRATEGLCEVRSDMQHGDLDGARTAFYDQAHLFLHQLAAQVQDKDLDQASSLLIAKYHLEDILPAEGQVTTGAAPDDSVITDLLTQVHKSAEVLGFKAPECSQ
jgi:hypothetical protein